MTEQTMLPLYPAEPREHDLPPRWDGLPVEWGQWRDTAGIILCPPPRKAEHCNRCGSTAEPLNSLGRVWTNPATAPPAIGRARLQRGRLLAANLTAFRCPDCEHDHVLDSNGKSWDLDPSDYTADGSWELAND